MLPDIQSSAASTPLSPPIIYHPVECCGLTPISVFFAFVFQPALLLQGTLPKILMATGFTALGVACLSVFLVGYVWSPLSWLHRFLFASAAILLVFPTIGLELIGIGLSGGLFVWARIKK